MNLIKHIDLDDIIVFKSVIDEYDSFILAVVGALTYATVKAILNSKNHKKIGEKLKAQIEVRECMRVVTSTTLVDRFLFLEIKNGANEVVNGVRKKFRVSVIDECHKDGLLSVKENYQNIFVDDEYQQMIQDGWEHKSVSYVVKDMVDCDLKKIYEREGVKYSRVYTIFNNKETKKTFFLSVASYENNFLDDDYTNRLVDKKVNEIIDHYEFIYN